MQQRRTRNELYRPFLGDELLNVRFDFVETKNEVKTRDEGYAVYDNIETVFISAPANKDCNVVAPVDGYCNMGDGVVVTYAERFPDDYERWKSGQGSAVSGLPLKQAPFLDKGEVLTLSSLGVYSVEQLADLGSHPLKTLGMKGRSWQQQAKAYLESARGSRDTTALAAENADLKARLDALERAVSGKPVVVEDEDPADDEADTLKAEIAAITGARPRGNPNLDTLRRMLEEAQQGGF